MVTGNDDATWNTPSRPDPFADLPSEIGGYAIEEVIGRGGMGLVFRARPPGGGASVALKVLLPDIADDPETLARFQREGEAAARVTHDNVVGVYASGSDPVTGLPFIAYELVHGDSLEDILAGRGRLPEAEVVALGRAILAGLAAIDAAGLVHRDVKPSNVLLPAGGVPKLADLGLAKVAGESTLTQTGFTLGTPSYMAPEQVSGTAGLDIRADLYAVGLLLYRAATGALPLTGETALDTMHRHVEEDCPDPRERVIGLSAGFAELVANLTHRDPTARYQTPAEGLAALEAVGRGEAPARPRRPAPQRRKSGSIRPGPSTGVILGGSRAGLWTSPSVIAAAAVFGLVFGVGVALGVRATIGSGRETDPIEVGPGPDDGVRPAPPEPPPPTGWTRVFTLADRGAVLRRAPLFGDDAGRRAEPLAAVARRGPDALRAAFAGEATRLADGRVRVRYGDLGSACSVESREAGTLLARGSPAEVALSPATTEDGPDWRLAPANDSSTAALLIGDARWTAPTFELRFSAEAIDQGRLALRLSDDSQPSAHLVLDARQQALVIAERRSPASVFDARGHTIVFAPGSEAGTRVLLDGRVVAEADEHAVDEPRARPISLLMREGRFVVGPITVTGRPDRTDHPAIALAPEPVGAAARVAARFVRDADGSGGPLLLLGDPDRRPLVAELDDDRLVLRHGRELLGRAAIDAIPTSGRLILERRGDVIRASLEATDGTPRAEIALAHPFAVAAVATRAGWGSSGPAVTFEAVVVDAPAPDPALVARARLDEAAAGGPAATLAWLEAASSADRGDERAAWRLASEQLARVTVPARADPSAFGPTGLAQRRARARAVAEALLRVAPDLEPLRSADAVARAGLAAAVAGDRALAARAAVALREDAVAADRLDALEWVDGRPSLGHLLASGYGAAGHRWEDLTAILAIADAIIPEPKPANLLYNQALAVGRDGLEHLEANVAGWEGELRDALAHLERARAAGYSAWDIEINVARYLEALGDRAGAIEAGIGGLAAAPRHGAIQASLSQLAAGRRDALGAVALCALADAGVTAGAGGPRALTEEARHIASTLPRTDDRLGDLTGYVLARTGAAGEPPSSDRPTAVLARTRAGIHDGSIARLAAAADLGRAADADRLVRAIALLDPELAPLLER